MLRTMTADLRPLPPSLLSGALLSGALLSRTLLSLTLLLLTSLLAVSPARAAEMYRWIDKNGVVNYSQIKPEGVNAEKIETRGGAAATGSMTPPPETASTGTPDKPKLTEEQQRKLDELKALQQQEEQQIAEIRRANCEKSRKVLERLKLKEHVRIRNPDGTERTLGEDERQRRIEEAQVGVAANCT
jgi:hypothetical protein